MKIKEQVRELEPLLVKIRRHFHQYPELSNQETGTMEQICTYLEEWGIEYQKGVADTGVVAIIRGGRPGRTAALRGDIDALPIQETNDVPYRSCHDGVMHACGHDVHTTVALGAAKILQSMAGELQGNVKIFFQPAEETTGGAERMIAEGCLENPHVDAVFGLHVSPAVEAGRVELRYGKMNAASDMLTILIRGRSTHGAEPQKGVDPIVIASNVVMALQSLISRNLSPVESGIVTLGSIHGGTKGNVIPDEVRMEGILRTLDPETRCRMKQRLKEMIEKVSEAYGGQGRLLIEESYAPLINDDKMVELVKATAETVVGPENIQIAPAPSMGAEDFSFFSQERPACFFNLGCGNTARGIDKPLHNSGFDVDEACLSVGVEMQVRNVLRFLNEE